MDILGIVFTIVGAILMRFSAVGRGSSDDRCIKLSFGWFCALFVFVSGVVRIIK